MKITLPELQKLIQKTINEELKKEGMVGDFVRNISGQDSQYFQVLSDLMSGASQALVHKDFLLKNQKVFMNKASYQTNGALNKAALNAAEATNKSKGVKGYGQGATINDVMKAVVQGYKLLQSKNA